MWFLFYGSFFLEISLLSERSIKNTNSVGSMSQIKSLTWNLWFNTNTSMALLIKLKALTLVTLINCITNYVTSILLIIFWQYLFSSCCKPLKTNPSEETCTCAIWSKPFLPNIHPHKWFMPATWKFLLLQAGPNLDI